MDFAFRERKVTSGSVELSRVAETSDSAQLLESILVLACISLANHAVPRRFGGHGERSDSRISHVHFVLTMLAYGLTTLRVSILPLSEYQSCPSRLQRLAENLVFAHNIGGDGKTGRQGDGKTLGDKGNGDTDAIHDESWYIDPARELVADIRSPSQLC
jgi:hypothetical protein